MVDESGVAARRRRAAVARPARPLRRARRGRGSSRVRADSSRRRHVRRRARRTRPQRRAVARRPRGIRPSPRATVDRRASRRSLGSRRWRARRSSPPPRARRRRCRAGRQVRGAATSTSTRRASGPSAPAITIPSRPADCFLQVDADVVARRQQQRHDHDGLPAGKCVEGCRDIRLLHIHVPEPHRDVRESLRDRVDEPPDRGLARRRRRAVRDREECGLRHPPIVPDRAPRRARRSRARRLNAEPPLLAESTPDGGAIAGGSGEKGWSGRVRG